MVSGPFCRELDGVVKGIDVLEKIFQFVLSFVPDGKHIIDVSPHQIRGLLVVWVSKVSSSFAMNKFA